MNREQKIIRTSIIGIVVNVVLVIFKMIIGILANSIAIILDAVNNLSDALSSIITIIGTKLAGRKPDKKHPYGYGRIEYLTSVIIAVIVLLAGLTSFKESVVKIFYPETASYSIASLVVIAAAVAAKLICGTYVRKIGVSIHSQSLVASGSDAFFDAVLSVATFVGAVINMIWGIGLEGILGALISLIIIKAGMEMLLETLNSIIGIRADSELSKMLKEKVQSYPEVKGAYDLILHNYGPTEVIGSIHIEVEDQMNAKEIHRLTRQITAEVYMEYGIILTVGIYASNADGEFARIRELAEKEIAGYPEILEMHGFYVEEKSKTVSFDLIIDFKADAPALRDRIRQELEKSCEGYRFEIILDSDYSD